MKHLLIYPGRTLLIFLLILSAGTWQCARVGNPSGGPKDTEPPRLIEADPENFSTHFTAGSITLEFNEFIQLDNINQKLVVSPPLLERPDVRLRGKSIFIDLNSPLLENTTYTLNFGDAISDINEGNVLENFLYVFSTGGALDSLETGGRIVDAFTLKPPEEAYAGLYDDLSDSSALLKKPLYLSKADKKGYFSLHNLKQDTFRMIALADANGNLKYDPGVDMIGFQDSVLYLDPENFSPVKQAPDDSVRANKKRNTAGPEMYLRLFLEDTYDQYLKTVEKPDPRFFYLIFNKPLKTGIDFYLLEDSTYRNWFLEEKFTVGDTLGYWLTDTSFFNRPRTDLVVSYQVKLPDDRDSIVMDTVSLLTRAPARGRGGKPKISEAETKKIERYILQSSASSRAPLELNQQLVLTCPTPVSEWDTTRILLSVASDSLNIHLPFTLKKDRFHLRNFRVSASWEPESRYRLTLFPGAVTDIYGARNDTLIFTFSTRKTEDYGNLEVSLQQVPGNMVVQLLDAKEHLIRQSFVSSDTSITFSYLLPAKYRLKAILDENNNGKWDTGNYLKHRQPEVVCYFSGTLNIRANWDLQEKWNLKFKK